MNVDFALTIFNVMAQLLVWLIGIGIIAIAVLYVIDRTQTEHTVRRNYPVIGRFRYWFEHLGEFFRQYFFAMDREEMPFNRAERSWVYQAAKNEDTTVAFGSTRDLRPVGSVLFVNCPYPTLEEDSAETSFVTIGPYCEKPYQTDSVFHISGMSYGAISKPAIQALSRGAKKAGVWMNTGEGAMSPWHVEGGADIVHQIGTAKYGVRDADGGLDDNKLREVTAHAQVKMIEIKLSQGAKPGKGGILPGNKVTDEISGIRGIPAGQASISPNRHPDINNVGELLDMIHHIREVGGKPVGIKFVVGGTEWLHDLFGEINHRGLEFAPDFITVDSGDGGTGAAPMSLMDHVGLPIRESLPMVVDLLCEFGLRQRVKVITSGKLVNPAGIAWALCAGADFVNSARGFMFALGCIQSLRCHRNTCPTGITTHDARLQKGLNPVDKAEKVANYVSQITTAVEIIAHSCGVPEPRALTRHHVRLVREDGHSARLSEIYPPVSALENRSVN